MNPQLWPTTPGVNLNNSPGTGGRSYNPMLWLKSMSKSQLTLNKSQSSCNLDKFLVSVGSQFPSVRWEQFWVPTHHRIVVRIVWVNTERLRTGEAYSIDSSLFKGCFEGTVSPKEEALRVNPCHQRGMFPTPALIEDPGLGPPYKPQGLCYPRPGRSETRNGKPVFLNKSPKGLLDHASPIQAEHHVFL